MKTKIFASLFNRT